MKHLTPNCQFLINSAIQNHLSINMAQDIKIAHFIFPKTKKCINRYTFYEALLLSFQAKSNIYYEQTAV